ncbi:hypothetical protein RO3G_15483 [Rhizopus delemar RA 99-880]|uniref:HSF-type DNA-binding domain-containing protein n=3 Tax=Rhizopus TaxID=4842 RepID=I1CQP2_RHIO9|nr:hypothetical protein RO3G_15483 [Rhizopus delemar RA 99-880]|eukprot:EIE90772.1 hypothetical protein RO3G_15483 [Rhizopus delemar RA 99-880]
MVIDPYYQHLISWSYSGSSFIVCNLMEFSKDVLPKHFKHNNFSSFVRQLNMYGFHKVNKSPRGHRTLAENQIWEFSHKKFLRNRIDLLDDIKRKAIEVENTTKREGGGDVQSHMALMRASQTDLIQQMQNLYQNLSQVMKDMQEMKSVQEQQAQTIKSMVDYISQQNGGQLPPELNLEQYETNSKKQTPSIFITSHDPSTTQPHLLNNLAHRSSLSLQTQNFSFGSTRSLGHFGHPLSPSSSPSPGMLLSDDEFDATNSLYSPTNSPHTPRQSNSHNTFMNPLDSLSHQ